MFGDHVVSLVVKPEKTFHYFCEESTHITNIAVCLTKDNKSNQKSNSISPFLAVLKLLYTEEVNPGVSFEDPNSLDEKDPDNDEDSDADSEEEVEKEVVIGTFTPNTMQITTDLYLPSHSQYRFVLDGSSDHEIHLLGRCISDPDADADPFSESDEESDEDDDLQSDDEGKFEELEEDTSKFAIKPKQIAIAPTPPQKAAKKEHESKKRPLEDKETEADVSMADSTATSIPEGGQKLSKSQRKKLKKAQAAEVNKDAPEASKNAPEASKNAPEASKNAPEAHKNAPEPKKKEPTGENAPNTTALPSNSAPNTVTLPSGLKITDSKIGTGADAKVGQTIMMRYIGKLANGTVFDSNTKGKPFSFKLGRGQVIKGWDEGIKGMKVGGERRLVIPANLAYGKPGSPPQIPPNSVLTFEVKLLKIQ